MKYYFQERSVKNDQQNRISHFYSSHGSGIGSDRSEVLAKDSIVISYRTPASSMHPHAQRTNTEATICKSIFDTLVDRDPTGKLIPSLATSWEMTSPTKWRFNLRKGVKWHNGDEFTAEDVAFTLKIGGNPISRFKFITSKIKEIDVVDRYTIDITTNQSWPLLADSLYLSLFIMNKQFCEGKSDEFLAENPMGTGAYKLVEWVRESHVKLEAFADHWRGPAPIKNVEFKPITNDSTRLAGLITGQTDMTIDVPVQYVEKLENTPKYRGCVHRRAAGHFFLYAFRRPDLSDIQTESSAGHHDGHQRG